MRRICLRGGGRLVRKSNKRRRRPVGVRVVRRLPRVWYAD